MCKAGDIIVINSYKSGNTVISHHSFIVLDDNGGQIQGVDFDFISVVMSSFTNTNQRERKLSYPGNFPIAPEDQDIATGDNGKYGYVKAEQFYYFQKQSISYHKIGHLEPDIFNLLIEFIETEMNTPIVQITDNL